MRYYFLSNSKCAVKVNGNFIGIASNNISYINLNEECFFVEFLPLSHNLLPLYFYIDKSAKSNENMLIIDLYGHLLLIPKFSYKHTTEFRKLLVRKFENGIKVNLISDGTLKLYIENELSFEIFNIELPMPDSGEAYFYGGHLAVAIKREKTDVYFFKAADSIALLRREKCDNFTFDGENLTMTHLLNALTRPIKTSVFNFNSGQFTQKTVRTRMIDSLPRQLLPLAFLQEVKVGCDFADFLCYELKEKSNLVREFFGDFAFVIPDEQQNAVNLISKDPKRTQFFFKDGLISNFICED